MVEVRCEHLAVEYSREELAIDGRAVIAHRFPCTECPVNVLIWDDDVDYSDIE